MKKRPEFISVVIPAAGKGTRMGSAVNKQLEIVGGIPVIIRTVGVFDGICQIDEIILVTSADDRAKMEDLISRENFTKAIRTVTGGSTRQESVYKGILASNPHTDILIIHDGARPFIKEEIIIKSIDGAMEFGACCAAVPVKDTIKTADESFFVGKTLARDTLFSVQTPQTFRYSLIKEAHGKALEKSIIGTDDSSLVEMLGIKCKIIPGSYENIKITTREDLILGELIAGNDA